jgi:outer membrane receptor protein involved in Fe transport
MGGNSNKPTLKGKIEGKVVDSLTNEGLSYVAIQLKKKNSAIVQDGVIAEEDGSFKFDNVVTGTYDIHLSYLGYKAKVVKAIETTLKNPDLFMGTISLASESQVLDGVEIKADKSLIENKADKLVFNAENDASIAGGDATTVLRKVPLLTVDLNGNVSLRGSQNVRILINGKPSGMFANNAADALKMFPADQIKQVEVITSPSAKYDGEGSAGIINIITKKQNIEGIAGSINTSIGNRQNSLFTNFNAGKGRFGSSLSGAVFWSVPADGSVEFYREALTGPINIIRQTGTQQNSRLGGNGSVSAFYDFNGYNSINSSFTLRGFGFDNSGTTFGSIVDSSFLNLNDKFVRTNDGFNNNYGFDWNTDYTKKFENKDGKELSFGVQYSKQNSDLETKLGEQHEDITLLNRNTEIINNGDNHETTLQVDFTQPFTKATKLEIGAKGIIRNIISNYNTQQLTTSGYVPLIETFTYGQDVYSGYASLSTIIAKKYSIIGGLRYEHTTIDGKYRESTGTAFDNNYDNFLPNFAISRTFKGFKTLKIAYSNRIQRPSLQYINPFNNNTDFTNRQIGNPALKPELVHQLETSYNFTWKGFTTFSSIYFKQTNDIIEQIVKSDSINGLPSQTSITNFQNIGRNNSFGLNTFISKSIKLVTLRVGGNIYTYNASGLINGNNISRNTHEYNMFVNGEFNITGSFKADFFGFFKSPSRTLQGDNPSFTIYGLGVRKEFKKVSVGITLIEPFHNDKFFRSDIKTPDFIQKSSFSIPFRSIGVNLRYKFGNVDFKERKSKVKNNDQKEGNDQQGGGGLSPGGGSNGRGS